MKHDEMVPDCVQCRLYFEENGHALLVRYGVLLRPRTGNTISTVRDRVAQHMVAVHNEHEVQAS